MNEDLKNIYYWTKSFGLLVNPSKSQCMIVSSRYMSNNFNYDDIPPVIFNGVAINYTKTARNLGLILDSNFSWTPHVNEISKRTYSAFHSLRRLQHFLPLKTKISLAQSLLLSLIDYADVCYLDATEELLNKLERLQNLCIRFIYGLRKFDHVSYFRKELKWLPIRLRRDSHILINLFKILNCSSSPVYLKERFTPLYSSDKPTRSHCHSLLSIPLHFTASYTNSFSVHAVRLWNSLPHTIRDSPTLGIFKKRLKEHYLSTV